MDNYYSALHERYPWLTDEDITTIVKLRHDLAQLPEEELLTAAFGPLVLLRRITMATNEVVFQELRATKALEELLNSPDNGVKWASGRILWLDDYSASEWDHSP